MSNFFILLLIVVSLRENFGKNDENLCNDRIRFNGKQTKSSSFCSSCTTFVHGGVSSPMIQFELPNLTKLTGISVRKENENQTKRKTSFFIEYRRTQDGPWRPYGKRLQRQVSIERNRLFFNNEKTRTNLPSLIVRQIRLIFVSSLNPICVSVEFYGCRSRDGLISTRLPQNALKTFDSKYDGWISETTARGGLGILTDGDTSKYLHWTSSLSSPIFLLFAFDSIKEFRSIDFDLKCSSCTLKIQLGIFSTIKETNLWTNRFRSLTLNNNQTDGQMTTLTHLILSVSQNKGQFVLIQITTNDDFALSEVTFDNRNEFETELNDDDFPSAIYIENSLRRLESLATKFSFETTKKNPQIFNSFVWILFALVFFAIFALFFLILTRRATFSSKRNEFEENVRKPSESEVYSVVEQNPDEFVSTNLKPINSHRIVNESAKATIRALTSFRDSMISQTSIATFHFLDEHLNEIDPSEIVILENLGTQLNKKCFLSEFAEEKRPVILHENDEENLQNSKIFSLSKLIKHENVVACLGFINVSADRCFLVNEHSRTNLFDYCQTLNNESENLLTNLMKIVNDIVAALLHFESMNLIVSDLTIPNCLLITNKDESLRIKLSDYAKFDDRFASRYVQKMPIRWLPGDLVIGDEIWSIKNNSFMFGTFLFELFHLASMIPYKDLSDEQVLEFYHRTWSHSKDNSIEPSVLCFATYFPRPILCHDRLYALMERCLSWSTSDRPSFREISLCLNETTTVICE